ncbi:hypothetical protein SOVF_181270, partial [Spinacia oleracea]
LVVWEVDNGGWWIDGGKVVPGGCCCGGSTVSGLTGEGVAGGGWCSMVGPGC